MGKNWAIAIGINHYDNLQPLKYAQRDAEVMAAWFKDEAKFDQVFLFTENSPPIRLTNPPIPTQPTYARFQRFLDVQFERRLLKPEDNLWFFFAGHGRRYADQDYLMFLDSNPQAVDRTAISVDYVTQRLRRSGADNVVLFIDACRDEDSRSGLGIGQQEFRGVVTFYSCAANQKSWEIDELQHGSFTHTLLEGLRIQGEANCATVERLEQYLRYFVPRLNAHYRKPGQNPYLKAEPPYKMYYILLEKVATLKDAEPLKYRASQAENKGDFELAKQLWKRVLALPGVDEDAWEAIERISRRQIQSSTTSSNTSTSSTGGRGTNFQTAAQREVQHQQNLAQYRNSFSQAVEREFPLSKGSRRELRGLQKSLRLTDKEVSQIEQPIIAPKEAQRRRQQEQERIRQQQEAERLRQQREAEQLQKREAQKRQRQQQLEKWRQLFSTIATRTPISRRGFLQWAGLGGGGLVIAAVFHEFFNSIFNSSPKHTSSPNAKTTPSPSPKSPKITPLPSPKPISLEKFKFEVVTVNSQGKITSRLPNEAELFKENLGNGVTLEMVSIPGGSFKMGTEDKEIERLVKRFNVEGYRTEKGQHQVTVPTFFMGKFEVTQEQYQQVMGKNPSDFKGDKRPVEQVSWNDAVEFCKKLSQKTGLTYRLPSEAEWEYACRAGTTTLFHFGETITSELANYNARYTFASEQKGEYREETTPVGQFPPNAFGLYDMHGNVWEWCQDSWHDNYNAEPRNGSAWVDNNNNSQRVLRGGSWFNDPGNCRSANRISYSHFSYNNDGIGLRVVCVVAPRTIK